MGTSKILVGLLLAGVITTALAADNPYEAIVARNVFGLKDPPPPPNPEDNKPPPPKILLRGFANAVGRKLVLFDVETPARPPQQAGRSSLVLGVGEAQNDIEVLEIVEATGTVKFRNNGVEDIKTLEKDSAKPTGAALPLPNLTGGPPNVPTVIAPRQTITSPGLQSIPTRGVKSPAADSPIPPPPPGAP